MNLNHTYSPFEMTPKVSKSNKSQQKASHLRTLLLSFAKTHIFSVSLKPKCYDATEMHTIYE